MDTATAARAVLGVSVARLLEHTALAEADEIAVRSVDNLPLQVFTKSGHTRP